MRIVIRLFHLFKDVRLRLPLLAFVCVMLILSLERLAIYLCGPAQFQDVPASQRLLAFVIGLRFDLVIGCSLLCLILPPWALTPQRWLVRPWPRRALRLWTALLLCLALLMCVFDFFFFQEFSERLNHKALLYLHNSYLYDILWRDYPVVTVFAGLTLLLGGLLVLLQRPRLVSHYRASSWRRGLSILLLSAPLLVLGIRSSLKSKAINTSPAYFSESAALAQLALNGLFTLREAADSVLFRREELSRRYQLLPEAEALAKARELVAGPGDTFKNDPVNPLRCVTETGHPRRDHNVVLVMMESLSWPYVGELGGMAGLTPNLDRLARAGLLMERCFAVGGRTTRGKCALLCGYPDLPGDSVTTRIEAEGNFFTLGHVLGGRGYETMFIYGGQAMEEHNQAFLCSNGFTELVFEDQFRQRTIRTGIGWCDEDLFAQALYEFKQHWQRQPQQPFFATLFTLSFHRPYLVPEGRIQPLAWLNKKEAEQVKCLQYADWAIGEFIRKARQEPYFDNTIFVFVADHMGGFRAKPMTAAAFRVPFIIYAPAILSERSGKRIATVCSQMDVGPTIMELLGGSYEHTFFGRSVLQRPAAKGWASFLNNDCLVLVDGGERVAEVRPDGAAPRLFQYAAPDQVTPRPVEGAEALTQLHELQTHATALFQSAEILFERGAFNLKARHSDKDSLVVVATHSGVPHP